jgi:hypothetical protein
VVARMTVSPRRGCHLAMAGALAVAYGSKGWGFESLRAHYQQTEAPSSVTDERGFVCLSRSKSGES